MESESPRQNADVTPGMTIRKRREALGLSQRQLGEQAGRGLSTIQDFELGRHVSAKSVVLISQAMDELERQASLPREPMVTVSESEMRAVLDEVRALRRLVEDLLARDGGQR